jgi:hypothetical protein
VLRPMFEAAPSVASPLSLCRAAASGHQCANAVAAAKAYEDYKHERNERGNQNTPEDSCLTYWNPKRRSNERCALGAQDRRPIRNADALPRDVESMRAAATPSGSGINVTCGGRGRLRSLFCCKEYHGAVVVCRSLCRSNHSENHSKSFATLSAITLPSVSVVSAATKRISAARLRQFLESMIWRGGIDRVPIDARV